MQILNLYKLLVDKCGPQWADYEIETLSIELGLVFDEMTWQKIALLKVLLHDAKAFDVKLEAFDDGDKGYIGLDEPRIESDAVFAIHAVDLINDIEIEPTVIAMPTVLELAYAIKVLISLPIGFSPARSAMWHMFCENVLKEEGIDRPCGPFTFLDASKFPERVRDEQEIKAVDVAIKAYISMMEADQGNMRVEG